MPKYLIPASLTKPLRRFKNSPGGSPGWRRFSLEKFQSAPLGQVTRIDPSFAQKVPFATGLHMVRRLVNPVIHGGAVVGIRMRPIAHYSFQEWLRAAPLRHRLTRGRNLLIDRLYRDRRAPEQAALVAKLKAERARVVAFTVAFNMPSAVDFLAVAMARFHPDTPLVVCDNSTVPQARTAIAALCLKHGLAYCGLPPAPYRGRNGSRSHAVALNWIWANLIRPSAPRRFALIDHDLIPLESLDLAARVASQPCYGMVRHGYDERTWYLWPGYSLFDFEAVQALPLDFGADAPLHLDTGGQNWTVLYRHLEPGALRMAPHTTAFVPPADAAGEREGFLLVDRWLHVGGAGHRDGGPQAISRVRRIYDADPAGFLASLTADAAGLLSLPDWRPPADRGIPSPAAAPAPADPATTDRGAAQVRISAGTPL